LNRRRERSIQSSTNSWAKLVWFCFLFEYKRIKIDQQGEKWCYRKHAEASSCLVRQRNKKEKGKRIICSLQILFSWLPWNPMTENLHRDRFHLAIHARWKRVRCRLVKVEAHLWARRLWVLFRPCVMQCSVNILCLQKK